MAAERGPHQEDSWTSQAGAGVQEWPGQKEGAPLDRLKTRMGPHSSQLTDTSGRESGQLADGITMTTRSPQQAFSRAASQLQALAQRRECLKCPINLW
jgi:hypothetical protein